MTPKPFSDFESDTLSLSQQKRIDSHCMSFEHALRAGDTLSIEDVLEEAGDERRGDLLFELLLIDLDYQLRSGDTPNLQAYETRFPTDVAIVQNAFDAVKPRKAASANTKPTDAEPTKIDRYEIVRAIGSGGFGVVYEASTQSWNAAWQSRFSDRAYAVRRSNSTKLERSRSSRTQTLCRYSMSVAPTSIPASSSPR